MTEETSAALREFTRRYCQQWQQQHGHLPASEELYGVASPCVTETRGDEVYWQPVPFSLAQNLEAVERALDLRIQPALTAWYTTQFAGDMQARLDETTMTLIQVWSEEDFVRVQENLIGHLVMKRRLKHSPTLFIATTSSELEVISLCNLSGEVILEQLGTAKRKTLAPDLPHFLDVLDPVL
ncbi:SecY-interacting protein [Paramixta manurensis]|uniref:Protein Syd n=1 Tax=Paramixta manurensis TaxID=2740817 RepID=A0A6M8UCQ4_9GAMM|nr:SecY-interacting protein [Erwiniaceae bacterium PD-1]